MNKDEPETALEYLKKVDQTLTKLESTKDSKDNSYSYAAYKNQGNRS